MSAAALDQRRAALRTANQQRISQQRMLREVAGTRPMRASWTALAELLEQRRHELGRRVTIHALLLHAHRIGDARAVALLRAAQVSPTRMVRELTDREVAAVAEELRAGEVPA